MADLSVEFMGLKLPTPVVVASSALSNRVENLETAEGHGAGAVVLRSLFEEQIEQQQTALDDKLAAMADSNPEARTYFPPQRVGPHEYLALVEKAKKAVKIPVIASLNCSDPGSWTGYAKDIERAGADALEVNIYKVEADPLVSGAEVEKQTVEIVAGLKAAVKIPIAVKLSPYYTSVAHVAAQCVKAGAKGVVLFNRFMQPDISLEKLAPISVLNLSQPGESLLPLRWIGLLHGRVNADLVASGGVHDSDGALKMILAGAKVVQVASALMRGGIPHLGKIVQGLDTFMERRGHSSWEEVRGTLSQRGVRDTVAFERAQYVHLILSQNV